MCQYSAVDGTANDWHLVHLGSRAVGGAGLVMVEASAVEERGRISHADLGIWKDDHIEPLQKIARFLKENGAIPGMQIAHAGRKASTEVPWRGGQPLKGRATAWQPVAPSAVAFTTDHAVPEELAIAEIHGIVSAFAAAAQRAASAGFEILEIHAAHGYLIHEFLSPLANHRTDQYGGALENRTRFAREVVSAVRSIWPDRFPLFMRISATDWMDGGWTVEDSVALGRMVKPLGVDLIDCSSGGTSPAAQIKVGPGFQVPFAEIVRRDAGIPTGAVGLITDAAQADEIIKSGQADMVLLAREFLRDPYWPIHAAIALGVEPPVPSQYVRAYIDAKGRGSR
jgi:2,4-dienoyl-CoA reductase-like NADH-dependent reductase (Old Yellow Enzyme family)